MRRSEEGADAAFENGNDGDMIRRRNWLSSTNPDSKAFETSNSELASATCRRSAVEDVTTPKRAALTSRENLQSLYKAIDTAA